MPNCIEYLQQAHQLVATARTLRDQANKGALAFVNTELDMTKEFAERALAAFSAGEKGDAKQAAAAAKDLSSFEKISAKIIRPRGTPTDALQATKPDPAHRRAFHHQIAAFFSLSLLLPIP
jgi:hypothetical protein